MSPIHILLVEDNDDDILLTKTALINGRIVNTISIAKDGWQTIQFLEKKGAYASTQAPDLILLNMPLPKMNGSEVLKNNDQLKYIPVIIFTTSLSEKNIAASYESSANCFITKHLEVDEFIKVVASTENFWISTVHSPNKNLL